MFDAKPLKCKELDCTLQTDQHLKKFYTDSTEIVALCVESFDQKLELLVDTSHPLLFWGNE